ncbi:MAG TPA: NAD(P)-dependent alcohol dehydrogenase [Candidatus Bathyarchaeia archaeon]|nr:NAD(P)-dependent alcohol dehydrogenase [Candidatus Bathyarchaeia archaeon]
MSQVVGIPQATPPKQAYATKAFAAVSPASALAPATIRRRQPGLADVQIEILFCGICHSDLHTVRDEWHHINPTVYPCVPGHEIVGRVAQLGANVTRFKLGDIVGVGCVVDADHTCSNCCEGFEQFCPNATYTYNSPDKHGTAPVTYGGYSDSIVVNQDAVLRIPSNLDLAGAAPLLCAGITTYSPLRRNNVGPGKKVGVVGIGGLGHMGVKLAHAMGAHVVVFTTSPSKQDDALRLGANEVVISKDTDQMTKQANTLDMLLDCVAAPHDLDAYLGLVRRGGNMTLVGAPEKAMPVLAQSLFFGNKSLAGSMIGGFAETQQMLDFCGQHNIASDVEVIPIQKINEAYERMLRSDVKYRFSIDMASLK